MHSLIFPSFVRGLKKILRSLELYAVTLCYTCENRFSKNFDDAPIVFL